MMTLADRALRVLVIVGVVVLCAKLIHTVCNQILSVARKSKKNDRHAAEHEKRVATVVKLVDTTLRVMFYGASILMVLREFGLDITPLLTGAGIAGVALGFGSQSLVKDMIAGLFILIENQIRIGDVIRVNNGLSGSVERMELRVTAIRDGDGTLHIIPNGEIKSVSNMTYDFGQAVVDIPLPYRTDLARLGQVLEKLVADFEVDPKWKGELRSRPEILTLTKFEPSFMTVQLVVKTEPHSRWSVARELRRRLKLAFDDAGIAMADTPVTPPIAHS